MAHPSTSARRWSIPPSTPLLAGHGETPGGDVDALIDAVLRISWMVEELPELAELHLERVALRPEGEGVVVHHARARLEAAAANRAPREPTVPDIVR